MNEATEASKHTPGPWEYHAKLTASENHKGFDLQDSATQHWLATISPRDMDGKEGEANARLIAAAPKLLEALERAVTTLKAWHDMGMKDDQELWRLYQASPEMKQINGAIALARGVTA